MECSYCKQSVDLTILLEERVPGAGSKRNRACIPCFAKLGEKKMQEYRQKHGGMWPGEET